MKNLFGLVLMALMMACGATKVEQEVTLTQRPVYKRAQNSERPKEVKDTPKEEEKILEEDNVVIDQQMPPEEKEEMTTPVEDVDTSSEEVERATEEVVEEMPKTASTEMPTVNKSGELSTSEGIGTIMTFLTSDELQGRDSGSEGIEKAAVYIESVFKANAIEPYFDTYRDVLSNYNNAYNVVGILEGNDRDLKHEYIVIGAHYDHIGIIEAENGDDIANGANDNASGTTTVLELARYFGNNKTNKRSIIFALFSAEEKGLLGSKHLAQKLKTANLNLYIMLNYEMVGVPLVDKDYLMYVTGFEESNLAGVCNMFVGRNLVGYLPKAKEFNLFKRSDNYPFFNEFNVPSQTFSTFDFTNFDHYHKVGDEAELMDFEHMAEIVNRSIPMIESVSNSLNQMIKLK